MPDFTKALATGLDARRKVFHGTTATLVLLEHAKQGRRGYDALLSIASGWHLASNDDGLPVLEIAEVEPVTKELLLKAAAGAFAFNGKVYKVDANNFIAPIYPSKRVWKFTVKTEGQQYP